MENYCRQIINLVDENKEAFDDAGIRIGTKYVMIEEENKLPQNDILDKNVKLISEHLKMVITIENGDEFSTICWDKSTAIKFAKTLRTEINKITESEGNNE